MSDRYTRNSGRSSGQDRSPRRPASDPYGGRTPDRSSVRRRSRRTSFKLTPSAIIPLAVLALIVILGIVAVIRLVHWNKGTASTYDPTVVNTAYDVEVLDVIIPIDPALLEGRTDDGTTTVLFLGDDPVCGDDETGLAGQIAKLGGNKTKTISAGFPDSQIASVNALFDTDYLDDAFNFYYVANAINMGDYTTMETVATIKNDIRFKNSVETLKSVDFESVDIIAVMYDASDYLHRSPVWNDNDDGDLQTYTGALKRGIELIKEAYPHIRLVFLSPTYAFYPLEDGTYDDANYTDLGNGALPTYVIKAIDVTGNCGISFIDNYFGSVNENNHSKYLADHVHLNEAGFRQVARHFVSKILNNDKEEFDPGY